MLAGVPLGYISIYWARGYGRLGYAAPAGDGATVALGGDRARYGRHGRRKGKAAPVTPSRDGKHAFGVLGDGESCCMSRGQKDPGVFIRTPGRVRRRFGKVPVSAGNASWHKPEAVLRHAGGAGTSGRGTFPRTPRSLTAPGSSGG